MTSKLDSYISNEISTCRVTRNEVIFVLGKMAWDFPSPQAIFCIIPNLSIDLSEYTEDNLATSSFSEDCTFLIKETT